METEPHDVWLDWRVCPGAGFEIHGRTNDGVLPLKQKSSTEFSVGARLRFRNDQVEQKVINHLKRVGAAKSDLKGAELFAEAACYNPDDGLTDLASIPRFLRWLVNTYGAHTLAAIIHDKLITDKANTGALHSDVVSDRFFREMLHACRMPWLLRWTMWTAVALRTRWKAGGLKRLELALWALASVAGMGGTILLLAAGHTAAALGFGALILVVAGLLWGRQWGAAMVAALALPMIAPAALLVLLASGLFWVADRIGRPLDKDFSPQPIKEPAAAPVGAVPPTAGLRADA